MITRRLWLALRYPQSRHPLYRQVVTFRSQSSPWLLWFAMMIFAPVLLIPALPFTATAYGLIWTVNITQAIVHLHATNRYYILSVSPDGEPGINWAVCTGTMHRNGTFERLHSSGLWVARFLVGFIVLSTIFDSLATLDENANPVNGIALYGIVGVGVIVNHYQSVVISALCSMLIPTFLSDSFSIRAIAPTTFLSIQIMTYLLTAFTGSLLISLVELQTSSMEHLLIQFVLFAFIREISIFVLWRSLLYRLKSNWIEAQPLLDWRSHLLV